MEIKKWHRWRLGTDQALDIQRRLQARVSRIGRVISPHFIAGVDISVGKAKGMAQAAVTVFSYPELRLVEVELAQGELDFP